MNGRAFPMCLTEAGPGGCTPGTRTPRTVQTRVPHTATLGPGQGLQGVSGAACSTVSRGGPHSSHQQEGKEVLPGW